MTFARTVKLLLCVFGFAAAALAPGQESPGKVVLTQTRRLEDGQAGVFFKAPRRILEIPGQWIYLLDDHRALKFDAAGKGYGLVVPRGEGPGELTRVHYAALLGQRLAFVSAFPFKVVLARLDGTFQGEFRPSELGSFFDLESTFNGRMLLSSRKREALTQARKGLSELPVELSWMDMQGRREAVPLKGIRERIHLNRLTTDSGRVAIAVNNVCGLKSCLDPARKRLYLAYTPRYAVDVVDLETGKRLSVLKRPFQPVDYYAPPREEEAEETPHGFEPYEPERFNDILAVHLVLGELWVITSDYRPERGFRVDRFDGKGNFSGSVFLSVPGVTHPDDLDRRILEFTEDRLWVNVPDEDENPVPVRYTVSLKG